MTKGELLALADRCEAATGANRELDVAAYLFDGAAKGRHLHTYEQHMGLRSCGTVRVSFEKWLAGTTLVPRYTASLDAALTLVPNNQFGAEVNLNPSGTGCARAWNPDGSLVRAKAATPALALTAAALRARAGAA